MARRLRIDRASQLSTYTQWLTTTHMPRWHAHRGTHCTGLVYQGRFRSLPIEEDAHFLTVCRYVEPNAPRGNLVEHPEDWPWCSLARRRRRGAACAWLIDKDEWLVGPLRNCRAVVNRPESAAELEALGLSVNRGAPYGESFWQRRTAKRLRLESNLHPPWHPKRTRPCEKK